MGFFTKIQSILAGAGLRKRPKQRYSVSELRAAGSAMAILAESLSARADEWMIEGNLLRRDGIEITWSGDFSAVSTTVHVRMDGKGKRMSVAEAWVLREAVALRIAKTKTIGNSISALSQFNGR